jgi:predicted dinucleotide-utilizing enzyme
MAYANDANTLSLAVTLAQTKVSKVEADHTILHEVVVKSRAAQ